MIGDDTDAIVPSEAKKQRRDCPYLDTVNRAVLDFDFEKVCSVTLTNVNIYACLCCGLYFKGRGVGTPAHSHSLQSSHYVFVNLSTERVYCLPDDYEVLDSSLDDVKRLLRPRFTKDDVARIDAPRARVRRLVGGGDYLPGFVGLNNLSRTDAFSSVAQCLAHVPPLRDFFLCPPSASQSWPELSRRFGELIRKMWSPYLFKGQVSPHEVLQSVQSASSKRFRIGKPFDPLELLQWLLEQLSVELRPRTGKGTATIVQDVFQGEVEVTTITPAKQTASSARDDDEEGAPQGPGLSQKRTAQQGGNLSSETISTARIPFLHLELELPPMPLFKEGEKAFIPQVPLTTLMEKFDRKTESSLVTGERKRFSITKLPRFLILHMKRFTNNNWFLEKNTTIVNFPIRHLDLCAYLAPEERAKVESAKYDLLCSIKHDGTPENGTFSAFVRTCRGAPHQDQWFEMQDLTINETIPQLVSVSEAYVQIWMRQN